jgi:hypothetical protein
VSTVVATLAGICALGAAGLLPVLATVGLRWYAVPLAPLAGAVAAGLAATASVTFGGPLLDWFVAIAVLAAGAVCALLVVRPDLGLRADAPRRAGRAVDRVAGVVGFLVVVVACAWSLRGLRTPTVGFDARALWVMRPGWFLHGHAQQLTDLRARNLVLTQSAYPPLLSASVAVAWRITGIHTARLGVTVVAVLDACALAAAALAVAQAGRTMAARVSRSWLPMVAGIVVAALLVVVASGITEPFLTNGYADPLWSLAAVAAVAFGLQLRSDPSTRAAAVILVLVAGMSKNEGFVTAVALVVLVAARSIGMAGLRGARDRLVTPLVLAACELAALAWWPVLMRAIHARGASSTFTASQDLAHRTDAVVHGFSPYLHVLVLAAPLAVLGGLVLRGVRRQVEAGNDLWAWLALATGGVAVASALVTGSGAIGPWLLSTAHRITEFPALAGWWIVGLWAVVATAGLAGPVAPGAHDDAAPGDPTPAGVDLERTAHGLVGAGR